MALPRRSPEAEPSALAVAHLTQRRRAVVVDDMELLRDQMARCLERNGFMTDRAANGLEAFRLLERLLDEAKRPDVLVVDGHMPIANGWQLIRTLRSTPAFLLLPVLFVSGSAEDTGGVEEFSPPVRFLPKPFDCTALIDAVEGLLAAS